MLKDSVQGTYSGANSRNSPYDLTPSSVTDSSELVIFAHGYKGFKDWGPWDLVAKKFAESGFDFLKFNFSHNGGTVKEPIDFPDLKAFSENTYSKELDDLHSLIKHIDAGLEVKGKRKKYQKIHLIGHSRGGGISILFAQENERISKLVTWAAVSDFAERFPSDINEWRENGVAYVKNSRTQQDMPHNFEFYLDFIQNRSRLDIPSAARKIEQPWLIAHGEDDDVVCVSNADFLINLSPSANLLLVRKTGHTFGGSHPWSSDKLPPKMAALCDKTIEFLKEK